MSIEYVSVDLERKVLKGTIYCKSVLLQYCGKGRLGPDIFSDKSYRSIYRLAAKHFMKTGEKISLSALETKIDRVKFTSKKAKDVKAFRERLRSVLDTQLSKKPTAKDMKSFEVYLDELVVLQQGRALQEHTMELYRLIDNGEIEAASEAANVFSVNSAMQDMDESEHNSNFAEREQYVIERFKHPDRYKLVPTGVMTLDKQLGGGIGQELMIVAGASNAGKSFFLQTMAANCRRAGLNVVLFTIEMQLLETQFRLDCNFAGIDYKFFRNPAEFYSEEVHEKWKKKLKRLSKKPGSLTIVAFQKNAKMSVITGKMHEIVSRLQAPIDVVLIDYLDDIEPEREYKEYKSWASFGEISWDMHLLAKGFPNAGTKGIPVVTASQLSKKSKEVSYNSDPTNNKKRRLDERDTGSSPLPYRHSDIYLGIQTIEDGVYSGLEIMKGRFHAKRGDKPIICFHNYAKSRFHDEAIKTSFVDTMSDEDKSDMKQILDIEDEDDTE